MELNITPTPDVVVGQLSVTTQNRKWSGGAESGWELLDCKAGEGKLWANFTITPLNPDWNPYERYVPVEGRKKNAREWFEVIAPSLVALVDGTLNTDVINGQFVAAELVPQPGKPEYTTFRFVHLFGKGTGGQAAADAFSAGLFGGAAPTGSSAGESVEESAGVDEYVAEMVKAKWAELMQNNAHLPRAVATKKSKEEFEAYVESELGGAAGLGTTMEALLEAAV